MKKTFFYFLPFLFFILGYYGLSWLASATKIVMPSVVGCALTDAMLQFSVAQLNVRILALKEEVESAPGTIIQQIPVAGSLVKPNQRVFVVIAKQPDKQRAPHLVGLSLDEAKVRAKKEGIQLKQHEISSAIYPNHMVIAQAPHADVVLEEKMMHIYVCEGEESIMLLCDFTGQVVTAVQDFCAKQGIGLEIAYETPWDERSGYDQCVVKDQRPLAGSLVNMKKPLSVQMSIEKAH